MKRCTHCGKSKPLTEFYEQRGCRDGRRSDCKACFAKRAKVWYQRNRDRAIANAKAWTESNPERVRVNRKAARGRRKVIDRDARLRRVFGISADEYAEVLAAQGGVCALCGRKPREGSSLHVDHNHETGEVRGLLCFSCNAGLGQLRDDPNRMVDAVLYLMGALPAVDSNREERGLLVGLIAELAAHGTPITPLAADAEQLATPVDGPSSQP